MRKHMKGYVAKTQAFKVLCIRPRMDPELCSQQASLTCRVTTAVKCDVKGQCKQCVLIAVSDSSQEDSVEK